MTLRSLAAIVLAVATPCAMAAAPSPSDVAQGKQAYAACAVCHSVAPGSNGMGPTLFGVVGQAASSVPGFNYSSALKNSKLTWTPQNLDAFVANPQQLVPGNTMPYSGMADAQQRAALVAYLQTLH
ncbi:MAG: c-type cytochrome [Vicinamibacterales bacterium]|nr:c-type cytochrome [Vicinamibacterales bacterium]